MNIGDIIGWIIIGGLAGWIAGMVMNRQHGIVMNIVIGIVGAVIGGFLAQMLHIGGQADPSSPFNLYTFLIAFVGACILLAILKFVNRRA